MIQAKKIELKTLIFIEQNFECLHRCFLAVKEQGRFLSFKKSFNFHTFAAALATLISIDNVDANVDVLDLEANKLLEKEEDEEFVKIK